MRTGAIAGAADSRGFGVHSRFVGNGNANRKGRSLSGQTVDTHSCAHRLGQTPHRAQAESRSLISTFRGEERLEDPPPGLLIHTAAIVGHGEDYLAVDMSRDDFDRAP